MKEVNNGGSYTSMEWGHLLMMKHFTENGASLFKIQWYQRGPIDIGVSVQVIIVITNISGIGKRLYIISICFLLRTLTRVIIILIKVCVILVIGLIIVIIVISIILILICIRGR